MATDLAYYRKVFGRIASSQPRPLYLLAGEEQLIMEELAAGIAARNVPDDLRSFNLSVEYGGEIDMEGFISAARSYPFLAERRVLIIRELERLKGGWKPLLEYCSRPTASTVAVFIYNTHDERGRRIRQPRDFAALEKAVAGAGEVISCRRLGDAAILKWIVSASKKLGLEMNAEAGATLLASVGPNLFDLRNELEKLSIVFGGERISSAQVAGILGQYRVNAVFDLIASIRPGNESETLRIMARIIRTGAERPSVVVYHLIRHFLALLKAKAGHKGGGYGLRKLVGNAGNIPTRTILVWLENLRVTELLMKSTSFPEDILLDAVVLHSTRGALLEPSFGAVGAA